MTPRVAVSDSDVQACYPVMRQLRPHLREESFLERVRSLQTRGYRLAYVSAGDSPVAVAGFRIGECLAWGRFLYVDDLVTAPSVRSKGYGSCLLRWLREVAESEGCEEMHLDSGVQRADAHRFYEREGMQVSSYHFSFAVE